MGLNQTGANFHIKIKIIFNIFIYILQQLPQGINPSALILCSSSSKALEVNSLCMEFVESYKTIRCVAAINGKPERSLVVGTSFILNKNIYLFKSISA